ncbi:MAG: DUF4395 family protein [Nitriliruptorales bacterium]|nr:DUF4395 family protein [Nitriliruptorales bacterium]
MTTITRAAHPYTDTSVIDARAPRFNQATVGVLSLVAVVTGWWWLLALLALQLILGLTMGRRWCLPCVFYFEVVQPHLGEGRIEDSRPPRFANILGAVFLTSATLAHLVGLSPLGNILGGMVAALALLAAVTGLCVGCEFYKLGARLRGVRPGQVDGFDLATLGAPSGEVLVEFTHPLCSECREVGERLRTDGRPVLSVDVSEQPDLARRYHVAVVPTAYAVAADGRVLQRLA